MSFFRRRMPQGHAREGLPRLYNEGTVQRNGVAKEPQLDWEFGSEDLGALFDSTRDGTIAEAARESRRTKPVLPTLAPSPTVSPKVSLSPSTSHMAQAFHGAKAATQVAAVEKMLNTALEQWWGKGELPATELLRDGLFVLEAGHDLSESQLTLLLRIALARGKGLLTALRHQTDSERTATLLKDALLDFDSPFIPGTLRQLREQDENSVEWAPLLIEELNIELPTLIGRQRQLAVAGLAELKGKNLSATLLADLSASASPSLMSLDMFAASWSRFRVVMLALLALALVTTFLLRHENFSLTKTVVIPAGKYTVGGATATERTVELSAFALEQTEVTNAEYRRCYKQEYCPAPSNNASATRPQYFVDTAFDSFPVVNVDWNGAKAFCRWAGRRLPTADEWEVAASFAPVTKQAYRFPWGNEFDPLLANSTATLGRDTQMVGLYHPAGDSPLGLIDMAGNVAEWTMTPGEGEESYLVKGGSFQDEPAALQTGAQQNLPRETATASLGFRCAIKVSR